VPAYEVDVRNEMLYVLTLINITFYTSSVKDLMIFVFPSRYSFSAWAATFSALALFLKVGTAGSISILRRASRMTSEIEE